MSKVRLLKASSEGQVLGSYGEASTKPAVCVGLPPRGTFSICLRCAPWHTKHNVKTWLASSHFTLDLENRHTKTTPRVRAGTYGYSSNCRMNKWLKAQINDWTDRETDGRRRKLVTSWLDGRVTQPFHETTHSYLPSHKAEEIIFIVNQLPLQPTEQPVQSAERVCSCELTPEGQVQRPTPISRIPEHIYCKG